MALAIATAALVIPVSGASAATFHPLFDGSGADGTLQDSINAANANGPGNDTILIDNDFYAPDATMTITTSITIINVDPRVNRATSPTGGANIDSGAFTNLDSDTFVVSGANAKLQMRGIILSGGAAGADKAAIRVTGAGATLQVMNSAVVGNQQPNIIAEAGTNVDVSNSTIASSFDTGLINNGATVNLTNDTIVQNGSGGIGQSAGTTNLFNTIVANNTGNQCRGTAGTRNVTTSLATDSSCSPATVTTTAALDLGGVNSNGGPTPVPAPGGGPQPGTASSAINAGTTPCGTVDQRYFLRPTAPGVCDVGAMEVGAVADTTPPSCVPTGTTYPNADGSLAQQKVNLTDAQSGVLDGGPVSDILMTPIGTVSFTPLTSVKATSTTTDETNGLVVTATKDANPHSTGDTTWSFTATDYAGNPKTCS